MKEQERSLMMPLQLQFFAEGSEGEGDSGAAGEGTDGNKEGNKDGNQNQGDKSGAKEKTFTQADVTAMMTKEKGEGRKAVLNALGVSSQEEAEKAIKAFQAFQQSQLSDEEKAKKDKDGAVEKATEAEKRAKAAEDKLSCMVAGVEAESIEDALAIALLKVTEAKDLGTVLKEMKKEAKYAGFFGAASPKGSGTGSSASHRGSSTGDGNIGERLAKARMSGVKTPKESKFFNK